MPDMKQCLEPLKPLLLGKNAYVWIMDLDAAFEKSKKVLCLLVVLKKFDVIKQTIVLMDVSRKG